MKQRLKGLLEALLIWGMVGLIVLLSYAAPAMTIFK